MRCLRPCAENDSIVAVGLHPKDSRRDVFIGQVMVLRLTSPNSMSTQMWMGNENFSSNVTEMCLRGDGSKLFCISQDFGTAFVVIQAPYFQGGPDGVSTSLSCGESNGTRSGIQFAPTVAVYFTS